MPLKPALTTAALLSSLLAVTSAFAHAHLDQVNSSANSQAVRLVFSEGIEKAFSNVTLSRDGVDIKVKSLATDGPQNKVLVVTPAAPLAAGDYTAKWHAVSVDTHTSEGTYTFTVGK